MGFFGNTDAEPARTTPVPPPHAALASLEALMSALLQDLALAVLVGAVAPLAAGERFSSSDVYGRPDPRRSSVSLANRPR